MATWSVEDSEPEREQARREGRMNRRHERVRSRVRETPKVFSEHSRTRDPEALRQTEEDAPRKSLDGFSHIQKLVSRPLSHGYVNHLLERKIPSTGPCGISEKISREDLSKLTRCVVCDAPWYSRKSADQKLQHLESCSRKNQLHQATLVALLQRDIDNLSSQVMMTSTNSEVSTARHSGTLLTSVVNDTVSKRKRHDREANIAVKPEQACDSIRGRATFLFRDVNCQDSDQNVELAPPTQPFFGSKLGQRLQSFEPPNRISIDRDQVFIGSSSRREFPSTDDSFSASRIDRWFGKEEIYADGGALVRVPNPIDGLSHYLTSMHICQPKESSVIANPLSHVGTTSLNVEANTTPPGPSSSTCPSRQSAQSGLLRGISSKLSLQPQQHVIFSGSQAPLKTMARTISSSSPDSASRRGAGAGAIGHARIQQNVSKERLGRGKANKKKTPTSSKRADASCSRNDINTLLITAIKSDPQLLSRVIRFEPLPFDLFFRIVTELGFSQHGLKSQLKEVLDNQCINFYGMSAERQRSSRKMRK